MSKIGKSCYTGYCYAIYEDHLQVNAMQII